MLPQNGCVCPAELVHGNSRVFHCLVSAFQEQALLRVESSGFSRGHVKERSIESGEVLLEEVASVYIILLVLDSSWYRYLETHSSVSVRIGVIECLVIPFLFWDLRPTFTALRNY